ncbi:MAG: lipid IV(A) 3-deoxy-D-manno-octulosonic acid transferase [Moraxellaceae bacterium]|nr:lipid IV(A) 3-deoxy-D-manno-octulosonic acid transferase [Moraxellaceae bacterium]
MARFLYSLLFHLLLPLVLMRLLWRGLRAPAYRHRWRERFGVGVAHQQGGLWVHAVSVGETLAAAPLVAAWQQAHPGEPVFLSTMTPTGSARVRAIWGDSVGHAYAPYDLPWAWALFLRRVRPVALVIMETELWPNMIAAVHARGIPVLLANARLSERSARGYARAGWLARPMLAQLTQIAAQDEATADRFRALGVAPARVTVTGSLKFDFSAPADLPARAEVLRHKWALDNRPVLVAASTHEGEDESLLTALSQLRETFPSLLLVLVPRHPERFEAVARQITDAGFALVRRSTDEPVSAGTAVFLGDSMGELLLWYALADVAFVGGSLRPPLGGHNMLEPIALGVPTLSGPHVTNFQAIADELVAAGALQLVPADAIADTVRVVLTDNALREQQMAAGERVLVRNRGALARQMALLEAMQT